MAMAEAIPTLLVTGPVGVGKTSVAVAASDLLDEMAIAHAVVDMDALRSCYPRPADDRFNVALGMRNLAAIWANYRAVGAGRLIVADVIESRAQLADYRAAVPGAAIQVVRLRAAAGALTDRVRGRETGVGLAWHLHRTIELAEQMERDHLEDVLVDTDERSIVEVAREVLSRCRWLTLTVE